ncbi:MAG TPA: universal stress protein [Candidatus Nitrosotalea sp.]|nr:universal stress protein [Candidatus Nitrosotalea sp.]
MDATKRFERILLATDGSGASKAAVDATIALAKSPSAKVRVAHVWNLEVHHRHGVWDVELRSEAQRLVDATVETLLRAGVMAEREICRADSEHVAAALANAAIDFGADLVVVGSRGLSDWQSLIQGSISHQLLSRVDCPLLVVRGWAAAAKSSRQVLLAIAGGDDIVPAANAAIAAAGALGSRVLVLHVARMITAGQSLVYAETDEEIRATMSKTIELVEKAGITANGRVARPGPVATAIAHVAEEWQADLIVMGSGRTGDLASIVLGSVSHDLLHVSSRPVLIAERVKV